MEFPVISRIGPRDCRKMRRLAFAGLVLMGLVRGIQGLNMKQRQNDIDSHQSASKNALSNPSASFEQNVAKDYESAGAKLVSMWREFMYMEAIIGHILRDYNVAIKREKHTELADLMSTRHKQAEDFFTSLGGTSETSMLVTSELASLKDIKQELSADAKTLESLPDYRYPTAHLELIETSAETPVDLAGALKPKNARLLHASLTQYKQHMDALKHTHGKLHKLLKKLKLPASEDLREQLTRHTAELEALDDPDAPLAIHIPVTSRKH